MSELRVIPKDSFTIETTATIPQLVEAFQAQVEPRKLLRWGWSRDHKLFEGEVSESGFSISRIIHYRNSFRPTITGRFEPGMAGTDVKIEQQLPPFVILFALLWTGIMLQFLCVGVRGLIESPDALREIGPFLLLPFGMMLFLVLMTQFGFWMEARKSRAALEEILAPYMREKMVS
jgi:hypothetical protein